MVDLRPVRELARVFEPFHSVGYYSPEIDRMKESGYRGWWHAYFAYRFAPMGAVPAAVVVAAAYNFAPRFVERAVPGVWQIQAPADTVRIHRQLVGSALDRIFDGGQFDATIAEAASLARRALSDPDVGARSLFAAHLDLPWPDDPVMSLWHACTLLREHRGDSHNIALAAGAVDGVECHVLMTEKGHVNQATITNIRGWTEGEWWGAVGRLAERGWVDSDGMLTSEGRKARSFIERRTDELSAGPVVELGPDRSERLGARLSELVDHLKSTGEIPGVWPPPAVRRS